jgi:hypothetical protein
MASVAVRDRDGVGAKPAPRPAARREVLIVAGSLLAGLVAAIALVLGPLAGDREAVITGAILVGFAVGWTLLAVLSVRCTARPQRWAAVPAAAMAFTGAGLIVQDADNDALFVSPADAQHGELADSGGHLVFRRELG